MEQHRHGRTHDDPGPARAEDDQRADQVSHDEGGFGGLARIAAIPVEHDDVAGYDERSDREEPTDDDPGGARGAHESGYRSRDRNQRERPEAR